MTKEQRDREIVFRSTHWAPVDLAEEYGISVSTVYRILGASKFAERKARETSPERNTGLPARWGL